MRSLKLRAWSNENNRYCDFVTLDEDGSWIGWIKSCGIYLTTDDIILEQDTGLKDKNGKKICEGDIVRCWNGLDYLDGSVKWSENSAAYFVKYFEKKDCFDEDDWLCDCYCEVIGNVHENPELIGGEE